MPVMEQHASFNPKKHAVKVVLVPLKRFRNDIILLRVALGFLLLIACLSCLWKSRIIRDVRGPRQCAFRHFLHIMCENGDPVCQIEKTLCRKLGGGRRR